MSKFSQDEVVENLKKCPHFEKCSQNLCPLDLELEFRSGGRSARCRFMREAKTSKVAGRIFVSGGRVMPDASLNFVPRANLITLNNPSRERWNKLYENKSEH
jgi:hypothetical protein